MGNYQNILCCSQNSMNDNLNVETITNIIKENNSNNLLPYLSMGSISSSNVTHKKKLILYSHDNDNIKSIFIEDLINSSSVEVKKIVFGKNYFLGLLEDSNKTYLVGYGDNSLGQLGLNVNTEYYESKNNNNPINYYDYLLLINIFKPEEIILDLTTERNITYVLVKDTKLNKTSIFKFGLSEEELLKIRTVSVKEINPIKIEEINEEIINDINHIFSMKYRILLTSSNSIYLKGSMFNMGYNRTYKLFKKFNQKIEQFFTGIGHIILRLEDGKLLTMGNNEYGELGCESSNKLKFNKVDFFKDKNIKKISTGFRHNLILCDNELYAFGENSSGQCFGNDIKCEPSLITISNNNEKIIDCFAGADYSLLITESKKIYAWGNCNFIIKDELNPINDADEKKMRLISDIELKDVKNIFCGINHIIFYTEIMS